MRIFLMLILLMLSVVKATSQTIIPGDAQVEKYLPMLKGKKVGLLINQTARVGGITLLDLLLRKNVQVKTLFVPEHGFRGLADAGMHIGNSIDSVTGIPIISLYGANKKPSGDQLKGLDVIVYDLQDVGVRFYTYISTLQYMMEACAENKKTLIILDRPNPNGYYIDGPVLDTAFRSFVGMQPIPIVYGMTVGEYAAMLVGETWFKGAKDLVMYVIPCKNYNHSIKNYHLPVPPSPNLQTDAAVEYYPFMCLFEGTVVSVGRGTAKPFEIWGAPEYKGLLSDSFKPVSSKGATHPPYEGRLCYGISASINLFKSSYTNQSEFINRLLYAFEIYPDKNKFFTPFFDKLAGNNTLRNQIIVLMAKNNRNDKNQINIADTWQPALDTFKKIRKKYLLYEDFK